MRVGIVGAGIAGPTLAWWLARTGHRVTLIEEAPRFRAGGYIIDFWGVGYEVAERMGLIPAIRERGYQVREVRLMKSDGRVAARFSADIFRRMTNDRFTSLARGDLALTIFEAVRDRVEILFGNSVAEICDDGSEVRVLLESGGTRGFDLLVGADGLHSRVRSLAWGSQKQFEHPLGYTVAAFRTGGYPRRDEDVYVTYAEPGLSLSRFSLRGDRTLFLLIFADARLKTPEPHTDGERRAALHSVFGSSRWEAREILEALDRAEEIYFDRVSQIRVPQWSRGRTVLIGDAAACPSLLAGEGTGLAMTEACVLAGELHRAGGDVPAALKVWETRLRPFITAKQKSALGFASFIAPNSGFGVRLRNALARLLVIPPLADLLIGGSVRDDFDLPDYGI